MNGLHSPHHDPHQTTEREVKVRVNEVLGILSSLCISLALVMTSAYLLRMGVDATIPSLPISHLDKVIEDNYVEYDLSNFKFEWANLAHFILGVKVAEAAGYEAQVTELPGILTLKPGESGTLRVGFKNTGELRWRTPQTGTRYASIYTFDPKYHLSRLESKEWRRRDQPAVIESQTEADEIGYITIPVTAPFEPGLYEETFHLAIEDTAWVSGGKFSVSVRVSDEGVAVEVPKLESAPKNVPSPLRGEGQGEGVNKDSSGTPLPNPPPQGGREQVEDAPPHKALLLVRSHRRVKKPGGEEVMMRFGFKNIGDTAWFSRGLSTGQVAIAASDGTVSFAHKSWLSSNEPIQIAAGTVAPGQTEFFTFFIKTPTSQGDYNLDLHLMVDGRPVEGGLVEIPVTVTSNAANAREPLFFEGEVELLDEPRIRAGLFKVDKPVEFISPYPYELKDVNGMVRYELPKDTQAVIHYKKGRYIFYAQGTTVNINTHLRLEPKAPSPQPSPLEGEGVSGVYFEIVNHEERPTWNPGLNYNQFRDTFELRYSDENDTVWAINELQMEPYIAGLAEVSNNTPEEFRKAMAVAERTYAYYQLQDGRKHVDRNFDVSSSWGDQVYRGYAREKRFDKVVEGVTATRGEMITYNKDVVVTPYFARSHGHTHSWKEVWGGSDKPWLVGVTTEYDAGKTEWGHGVGMSQRDATHRAEDEDIDYIELLKHYYTGVDVERIYK